MRANTSTSPRTASISSGYHTSQPGRFHARPRNADETGLRQARAHGVDQRGGKGIAGGFAGDNADRHAFGARGSGIHRGRPGQRMMPRPATARKSTSGPRAAAVLAAAAIAVLASSSVCPSR